MLDWGKLITVYLTSTVKLFYAPAASVALGFGFWPTFITCALGGSTGVLFFYLGSDWFLRKLYSFRDMRNRIGERYGRKPRELKKFNRKNRLYVKIKKRYGAIGLAALTPAIISIPIGTVLAVRFFGRDRFMLPMLIVSVWIWAFALSYFTAFVDQTFIR